MALRPEIAIHVRSRIISRARQPVHDEVHSRANWSALGHITPEDDVSLAGRESIVCGRSASPGRSLFQSVGERPRRDQSGGFPRACVLCLLFAGCNHDDAGAGAALRVSSDDYEFLMRVWGHGAQRFFAPMFQNQRDRFAKVRDAVFTRAALTVGSRHLCAICDKPRAILFDNRRELVAHGSILALCLNTALPWIASTYRITPYPPKMPVRPSQSPSSTRRVPPTLHSGKACQVVSPEIPSTPPAVRNRSARARAFRG